MPYDTTPLLAAPSTPDRTRDHDAALVDTGAVSGDAAAADRRRRNADANLVAGEIIMPKPKFKLRVTVLPPHMQRRSAAMAERRRRSPKATGALPDDEAYLRSFIRTSSDAVRIARAKKKLQKLQILRTREQPQAADVSDLDATAAGVPVLTSVVAYDFASLLAAGLPAAEAVAYVSNVSLPADIASRTAAAWVQSRLVLDAVSTLNGEASWRDLTPEQRLTIALDKHFAELAYFLYTHSFADGQVSKGMMREAREAIVDRLAGDIDANSPFNRFLAALKKGDATLKHEEPSTTGMVQMPSTPAAKSGKVVPITRKRKSSVR